MFSKRNKQRLYVGFYPNPSQDDDREPIFHVALIVGPKHENIKKPSGTCYHVQDDTILAIPPVPTQVSGRSSISLRRRTATADTATPAMTRPYRAGSAVWLHEDKATFDTEVMDRLLARVLVAKVADPARLARILQDVPIVTAESGANARWRCYMWVENALEALKRDGRALSRSRKDEDQGRRTLASGRLDWAAIEHTGRQYIAEKERAGRYRGTQAQWPTRPTWDMLTDRELVS